MSENVVENNYFCVIFQYILQSNARNIARILILIAINGTHIQMAKCSEGLLRVYLLRRLVCKSVTRVDICVSCLLRTSSDFLTDLKFIRNTTNMAGMIHPVMWLVVSIMLYVESNASREQTIPSIFPLDSQRNNSCMSELTVSAAHRCRVLEPASRMNAKKEIDSTMDTFICTKYPSPVANPLFLCAGKQPMKTRL